MQLKKRFCNNYSAQVSYTLGNSRGNTSGNGAPGSNFQVGQDMHLELNEGPTRLRLPAQLHGQRHGARAAHARAEPELGGARVERPAVQPDQRRLDPDLNGIQAEPLAGGRATRATATTPYTVKNYKSQRNGARGPGFFEMDMRFGYRFQLPEPPDRGRRRRVQPDEPHELRDSDRQPDVARSSCC